LHAWPPLLDSTGEKAADASVIGIEQQSLQTLWQNMIAYSSD
jgi:hypothetical protein